MSDVAASVVVQLSANDSDLQAGLRRANNGIRGFASGLSGVLAGIGLAAVTDAIVGSAIEWESAFAGVRKTVDGTDAELAALEEGLRNLATQGNTSGLENAHVELARIAELAGQLGIAKDDILEFTETIALLGVTTDLTGEQGATSLAQFANITGMSIDYIDNLGATIVALGNAGASTESQIVEFGQRLAGAGSQAGLAEDEILAFGSAMASLGLNPEAGGTAFTQTINTIIEATARGGAELDALAEASGMTADAFRTNWEGDPAGALVAFLEGLGAMTPAEQLATLDELGLSGVRTSDTLRRMSGAVDLVKSSLDTANTAWIENTALQDEANERYDTTEAKLNTFKNNLTDLAISIGDILLPAINAILTPLNEFLSGIDIEEGLGAWQGVFENAEVIWTEIWGRIGAAWQQNVVTPIIGLAVEIQTALGSVAVWLQENIVTPIVTLADNVSAGLEAFKNAIQGPLDWIRDNVLKPFEDTINDIAGALNSLTGNAPQVGNGATGSWEVNGSSALGGYVSAGVPTLVGEQGIEAFIPNSGGRIIPNHRMGGGSNYNITVYGESPHELARLVEMAMRERDL